MFTLFQKKKTPFNTGTIIDINFTHTISLIRQAGLLFLEVSIEHKKYTFLLDTGAFSVVPSSLLQTSVLTPEDNKLTILDADGTEKELQLYSLNTLSIGTLEFHGFSVVCDDFAQNFPLSCLNFDGILGYNFLQNLFVTLDYKNSLLTLSDTKPQTQKFYKTKLKLSSTNAPQFQLTIDKHKVWLGLDTGKNDGIMFNEEMSRKIFTDKNYPKQRTTGTFSSSFLGTNQHSYIENYELKNFYIADKIFVNSFVCSSQKNAQNIIGNEFLQAFTIIIDFQKKNLFFKQESNNIEKVFLQDFGFTCFWDEDKKLYISAITQGTPAYNSKLKIGDRVFTLNALDTLNFTKDDYCQYFFLQNRPLEYKKQKELEIIVKRESKTLRLTLLKKP